MEQTVRTADLIREINRTGLIKRGNFTLKSGITSHIYFNMKGLSSHSNLSKAVAYELSKFVDSIETDQYVIAGVPLGSIPFASYISFITGIPLVMIRDEKKDYGLGNLIEGDWKGKKCILVEDVITTGSSIMKTIELAEKEGLPIHKVLVIVDREAGGVDCVREKGYNVNCLMTMTELTEYSQLELPIKNSHPVKDRLIQISTEKKSNLILSADISDPVELLNMIRQVCPYVVAVKLHLDLISWVGLKPNDFEIAIAKLKMRHNFLVIEDRKFADIAWISIRQFASLPEYIDLITVHGIAGRTMVECLGQALGPNQGILLVHQMSTSDNIIKRCPLYSRQIESIANSLDCVVGLIGQSRVGSHLIFSPGIRFGVDSDSNAQCYHSPQYMAKMGTNFFIVGRDIYCSDDPIEQGKYYRKLCWN